MTALELLRKVMNVPETKIGRAFWWESNACWGKITNEVEFLEKVWYLGEHFGDGTQAAIGRMMNARISEPYSNLPSFGTRTEHTGSMTLRQYLEIYNAR